MQLFVREEIFCKNEEGKESLVLFRNFGIEEGKGDVAQILISGK